MLERTYHKIVIFFFTCAPLLQGNSIYTSILNCISFQGNLDHSLHVLYLHKFFFFFLTMGNSLYRNILLVKISLPTKTFRSSVIKYSTVILFLFTVKLLLPVTPTRAETPSVISHVITYCSDQLCDKVWMEANAGDSLVYLSRQIGRFVRFAFESLSWKELVDR